MTKLHKFWMLFCCIILENTIILGHDGLIMETAAIMAIWKYLLIHHYNFCHMSCHSIPQHLTTHPSSQPTCNQNTHIILIFLPRNHPWNHPSAELHPGETTTTGSTHRPRVSNVAWRVPTVMSWERRNVANVPRSPCLNLPRANDLDLHFPRNRTQLTSCNGALLKQFGSKRVDVARY